MHNANGIQKLYCILELNALFAAAVLNIIKSGNETKLCLIDISLH